MNSKEALERLKEETQPNAYTLNHNDEDFAIIEQDLERLEQLEGLVKAFDIEVKILNQDLEKYKKAIEILKGRICIHNGYVCYDAYADIRLKDNEIEILKEVLNNDK